MTQSFQKKIIALDDHPLITEGLRMLLLQNPNYELCAVAQSWQELISKMKSELPDIAILDLNIQGKSILDKIEPLKIQFPTVKLLIFSSYNTPSLVKKAFMKNINGYLLKDTTQDEFLEALDAVSAGKTYVGNRVAVPKSKKGVYENEPELEDSFEIKNSLTERELEVIKLIAKGFESQEIANRLFISLHTIQSHRKNIMRKLDVHSASEIVRFAYENKLV